MKLFCMKETPDKAFSIISTSVETQVDKNGQMLLPVVRGMLKRTPRREDEDVDIRW